MARKRHPQSAGSADFYIKLLPTLLTMMSVLAASPARAAGTPGGAVPKIVVNILVDQLRTDYLEAFMPLYGDDGFKRLLRDGVVYTNADYPLAQPDIASAAATIASGTAPSSHGVVGRMWLDRETLRPTFCVDDDQYAGTGGTTDKSSARCLNVSTIGDELKAAGEDKPLVFAIAPSREAAILTAGHAANAAVWIDDKTGLWSSTNYYGGLPAWASVRNTLGTIGDISKTSSLRKPLSTTRYVSPRPKNTWISYCRKKASLNWISIKKVGKATALTPTKTPSSPTAKSST